MDYATPSDTLLRLTLFSGVAVLVLNVLLVAVVAFVRARANKRARHQNEITAIWTPIFHRAIEGLENPALPAIASRDQAVVLGLWINYFQYLRGKARICLRRLAYYIGLDHSTAVLLHHRNMAQRALAVVALGNMGTPEAWDELVRLSNDDNPMLSLLAGRAMLRINPEWAVPILLTQLDYRDDWPMTRIGGIFEEAPTATVEPHLREALSMSSPSGTARILSLLSLIHVKESWLLLKPLLEPHQPPNLLAAALRATQEPRSRASVLLLVSHQDWVVRAQAASALGRIGQPGDERLLKEMLGDPAWWVRYRAACALRNLPFVPRTSLEELMNDENADPFARDILRQALAEVEVTQ